MSDFVLNIHLFDSSYHQLHTSIPVHMDLVLPDYLYDDQTPLGADTYELKGKSVNHLKQVEAHYAVTTAMVAAVKLSYLLSPPPAVAMQSLPMFGAIPTWQTYTPNMFPMVPSPPPPAPFSVGFPIDFSLLNTSSGTYRRVSAEPECHCDIRMLMSAEHPAGCPWMIWKRASKKEQK